MYKFRQIIGKYIFPYHLQKIIVRYEKTGYNIDVLRQTAYLVVNPIKINNFAYIFDCTTVGRVSDRMTVLFVVVVVLWFYFHDKHLRSCRDGQLT